MAGRKKIKQRRLKVVLAGKVAAKAVDELRALIKVPAVLSAFPVNHEDPKMLKALPAADVMVGHFFTEGMARTALNLKLLQAPNAGTDAHRIDLLPQRTTVANAYFHGPAI